MPEPIDNTKARTEARKLFAHGSARAIYSWALTNGTAMLDEADENDRIIQALRRQRDEAEAALERVRVLADDWGAHAPRYSMHSALAAKALREALDGDQ